MLSEQLVLELVGLIYDAAGNPGQWAIFLEKFADAVKGATTHIVLYDVQTQNGNVAAAAIGLIPKPNVNTSSTTAAWTIGLSTASNCSLRATLSQGSCCATTEPWSAPSSIVTFYDRSTFSMSSVGSSAASNPYRR
jgi:hypothetical protein